MASPIFATQTTFAEPATRSVGSIPNFSTEAAGQLAPLNRAPVYQGEFVDPPTSYNRQPTTQGTKAPLFADLEPLPVGSPNSNPSIYPRSNPDNRTSGGRIGGSAWRTAPNGLGQGLSSANNPRANFRAAAGAGAVLDLGSRLANGQNAGEAALGTGLSLAGGLAGAEAGAAVGTAFLPGIGTAIGGVFGGALGAGLGNALANGLSNWFNPNRYQDPNPSSAPRPLGGQTPGAYYRLTTSKGDIYYFHGPLEAFFYVRVPGANRALQTLIAADNSFRDSLFEYPADQPFPTIVSIERLDQPEPQPEPEYQPNRVSFPDPAPDLIVDPGDYQVPRIGMPAPKAQPTLKRQPAPQPYPFPEYPGLPNPTRAPAPTQNPAPATDTSPSPAPVASPAPATDTSPSPAPNGQPTGLDSPLKSPNLNPSLNPTTHQFDEPETPTKEPTKTAENCDDPCVQGLHDKADENKPIAITVKVFKACKTDAPAATGNQQTTTNVGGASVTSGSSDGTGTAALVTSTEGKAIFEEKSIQVPKAEADNYKLLYARIAKLEALQCEDGNCIAAVPEWWQVRTGQKPQLVVIYAEVGKDGKLGSSRWQLTIPNYNKKKNYKPNLPTYEKGSIEGILRLSDNSSIIVNAATTTEAKRVLNDLKQYLPQPLLKGSVMKVGERFGAAYKKVRVTPVSAKFFSKGQANSKPDWTIDLKKK